MAALDFRFTDGSPYTPSLDFVYGATETPPEYSYTPSLDFRFPLNTGGTTPIPNRTEGQLWPVHG